MLVLFNHFFENVETNARSRLIYRPTTQLVWIILAGVPSPKYRNSANHLFIRAVSDIVYLCYLYLCCLIYFDKEISTCLRFCKVFAPKYWSQRNWFLLLQPRIWLSTKILNWNTANCHKETLLNTAKGIYSFKKCHPRWS